MEARSTALAGVRLAVQKAKVLARLFASRCSKKFIGIFVKNKKKTRKEKLANKKKIEVQILSKNILQLDLPFATR